MKLKRKLNERLWIGADICLTVERLELRFQPERCKVSFRIEAPTAVRIHRRELVGTATINPEWKPARAGERGTLLIERGYHQEIAMTGGIVVRVTGFYGDSVQIQVAAPPMIELRAVPPVDAPMTPGIEVQPEGSASAAIPVLVKRRRVPVDAS